jgi:hypothetical protein
VFFLFTGPGPTDPSCLQPGKSNRAGSRPRQLARGPARSSTILKRAWLDLVSLVSGPAVSGSGWSGTARWTCILSSMLDGRQYSVCVF